MTTWFTSDHHIDHQNILTLGDGRPFQTLEEQWQTIRENWNALVKPDDTVYHLGDWSMADKPTTLKLVQQLNGRVFLIPGNHDAVWKKPSRADGYVAAGWAGVLTRQTFLGKGLMLSHLPPAGVCHYTDQDERLQDHRPVYPGPIIHGHIHSPQRLTAPNAVHVGVDAWDYRPVSQHEIQELLPEAAR